MGVPLYQVDAFTEKPFAGNPAAICLLAGPGEDRWMQRVAQEMNLSETSFLYRMADGFSLRWFTPAVEVDLCGHATLASAHVLWEQSLLKPHDTARFHSRSGLLTAKKTGEWIELDFPARPAQPAPLPPDLDRSLGVSPRFVGKNGFDYLVEVQSEETVRNLQPDFARMKQLPVRGIIVTAKAQSPEFDFVSRFFAPGSGIAEDPVTGSSHCCLGPFWRERLAKDELVGYQASARGGIVRVQVAGDRVLLRGRAVTILKGELLC